MIDCLFNHIPYAFNALTSMDINNREYAFLFWMVVLFIFFRKHIPAFLKIFVNTPTLIYLLLQIITFVSVVVLVFAHFNLWNISQLKITIIWFFTIGMVLPFKIVNNRNKESETRIITSAFFENFAVFILLETLLSTYTMSFPLEVFSTGIISFLAVLSVFSEYQKETKVKKVLDFLLSLFGIFLLIFTLKELFDNPKEFFQIKTFSDYIFPVTLTLIYMPFLFLFAAYVEWEIIFLGLSNKFTNKRLLRYAKVRSLFEFNLNHNHGKRWLSRLHRSDNSTKESIDISIHNVLAMIGRESKRKMVPLSKGWSPFEAKDFLKEVGFNSGHYEPHFDDIWSANSLFKISDKPRASHISYWIEGDESTAKILNLRLAVNDFREKDIAIERFEAVAEYLVFKATHEKIPTKMRKSMKKLEAYKFVRLGWELRFTATSDNYGNNSLDATFKIVGPLNTNDAFDKKLTENVLQ